jgi:hypothetical protein
MKMAVFWVAAPCSLIEVYQRSMLPPSSDRPEETLVNFYQTTRRYNPEDSHLRITAVRTSNLIKDQMIDGF